MLARGKSATVLSPRNSAELARVQNYSYFARSGIENRIRREDMISLKQPFRDGRRLHGAHSFGNLDEREPGIPRQNSAPDLLKQELPPISKQDMSRKNKSCARRKTRPLTPLVVNSNRTQSTKSLSKSYRINLDLVPLLEVGTTTANFSVPVNKKRSTSLSSSDSSFSSGTPSLKAPCRSTGSPPLLEISLEEDFYLPRARSSESLEGADSDSASDDEEKDTMILRWLRTVEKSQETTSAGEWLPCINEGKLA